MRISIATITKQRKVTLMTARISPSTTSKTKKHSKKSVVLPICTLVVEAHKQPHVSLGNFTADQPPKGFSIHLYPDPEPDAIIAQVVKLGTEWRYELVLHIANYGNKTVKADVWPL
jgi:hypothetical protein